MYGRGEAAAAVCPEPVPALGCAASGQRQLDEFVEAADVRPGIRAEIESAGIGSRGIGSRRVGSRPNESARIGFGNPRPKTAVL